VLRQLLAHSLVTVDPEGYGTLLLTDASREVLKGERTLMLRRETVTRGPAAHRVKGQAPAGPALEPDQQRRFEALRAWRAATAREHGVPAYVIFHDATLREVAIRCPSSEADLEPITGIGVRKREAYGEALLRCVQEFQTQ
jgi:ATP-dependent DNA helicase RecQ